MRSLFCVLACVVWTGCESSQAGVSPARADSKTVTTVGTEVREVAASYRSLRAMTKKPVFVNPELAMLCRGANQDEVEEARKVSGPHANTEVMIYMNDAAADVFGKPNAKYPVDSVIVKEKRGDPYRTKSDLKMFVNVRDGVGGMIKRPAGYDPAHGDWEYFYFENMDKVESGKMKSCVDCHTGAASKDYVFGGWAEGKAG